MLTSIDVTVQFTGDAVNSTSTFQMQIQSPQDHIIGDYQLQNTPVTDYETITRAINIRENSMTPEQVTSSVLYLQLDDRAGNDRAYGNPSASFRFSDGQVIAATYKPFSIANYNGESNNTHQPVVG